MLATAVIHKKSKADISEIDALEYVKIKDADLLEEKEQERDDFSSSIQFSWHQLKKQPSSIKEAPHYNIKGLKEKAAKKLIQNARQFAYGLDWKH